MYSSCVYFHLTTFLTTVQKVILWLNGKRTVLRNRQFPVESHAWFQPISRPQRVETGLLLGGNIEKQCCDKGFSVIDCQNSATIFARRLLNHRILLFFTTGEQNKDCWFMSECRHLGSTSDELLTLLFRLH